MLADKAEEVGIELPHPRAETMAVLERLIPEYGAPGNPCDMTAQVLSAPANLNECFEALLADDQFGALVVPHTYAYAPATARIEIMGRAAARHGKIACAVWLTQHLEGPGAIETEQNPNDSRMLLFHDRSQLARLMLGVAAYSSPALPLAHSTRDTPQAMPGPSDPLGIDATGDHAFEGFIARLILEPKSRTPGRVVFWTPTGWC